MRGFQARNVMFCSVSDIGLTEERVLWQFKMRHIAYLGIATIFVVMGSGNLFLRVLGVLIGLFGVSAALYPRYALSFEAVALGVFNYALMRKRARKVVVLQEGVSRPKRLERSGRIEVRVSAKDYEQDFDEVAGEVGRSVLEKKKSKVRRI